MPTGYTYLVCDGKITEFPDFALSCARAFGALIHMRDEPSSAPIPDEIKPSTYHADKLPLLQAQLVGLHDMSDHDATMGAARDYDAKVESRVKSDRERNLRNDRIKAMLAKVEAWQPPTADHEGMKEFMLEQLTILIDRPYEQEPLILQSGSEWRAAQIASVKREIEYHTHEDSKERARASDRTQWLKTLRTSLAPQAEPVS
jgi:hypothetical protein